MPGRRDHAGGERPLVLGSAPARDQRLRGGAARARPRSLRRGAGGRGGPLLPHAPRPVRGGLPVGAGGAGRAGRAGGRPRERVDVRPLPRGAALVRRGRRGGRAARPQPPELPQVLPPGRRRGAARLPGAPAGVPAERRVRRAGGDAGGADGVRAADPADDAPLGVPPRDHALLPGGGVAGAAQPEVAAAAVGADDPDQGLGGASGRGGGDPARRPGAAGERPARHRGAPGAPHPAAGEGADGEAHAGADGEGGVGGRRRAVTRGARAAPLGAGAVAGGAGGAAAGARPGPPHPHAPRAVPRAQRARGARRAAPPRWSGTGRPRPTTTRPTSASRFRSRRWGATWRTS